MDTMILFCVYWQLAIAPSFAGPVMGGYYGQEYYESRAALCGTMATVDPNFGT